MMTLIKHLRRFRKEEDGAALVEYGITLLILFVVGAGVIIGLGNDTSTMFTNAKTTTNAAATTTAGSNSP